MTAYYNENDPYAAQWLRNLIKEGHIAPGDVDERSIVDVRAHDLDGYTQCHFFAGIGVWSYALRCAEWPDDQPVWTGSCPCQPFSAAGKGGGFDDERHLWPAWHHLISVQRPAAIFGEQVASKDGLGWLDLVQADLEGLDYACGAVPFPAAGVGAPHIRQRLYFVAYPLRGRARNDAGEGLGAQTAPHEENGRLSRQRLRAGLEGTSSELADAGDGGFRGERHGSARWGEFVGSGVKIVMGNADDTGPQGRRLSRDGADECLARPSSVAGFWADAEWIPCTDGKARPAEPGTFPLAHGAPARVGRLRAYGNAIVAAQATEFIRAAVDAGAK